MTEERFLALQKLARSVGVTIHRFDPASKGLGDVIAKATKAVGIKPCGKCRERQKKLNQLIPAQEGP